MQSAYKLNGFKNRNAYLSSLALNYSVDEEVVYNLADMLGPSEDFDGLVIALEDVKDIGGI